MVNRGLLRMLCLATDNDIYVATTSSAADNLMDAVVDFQDRTRVNCLPVNAASGRLALLWRYLQSAFFNISELLKSKPGDTIIYNFNNVFSIATINFLCKHFLKNRKVAVVCHGEMEYLHPGFKPTKLYKKLMVWLTRRFFKKKNSDLAKGLYFIVLGDVIKDELGKIVDPSMAERFFSVDHPLLPPDIPSHSARHGHVAKTRLGTVGIMNRFKGAESYISILEKLGNNPDLEFSIAGHVQSDLDKFRQLNVRLGRNPSDALPADEFNAMVADLDYILLLYPRDSYRMIASGALLDTIRFRKPLIAISTPYFEYFFNKFGKLGLLADSADDIVEILQDLPNHTPPAYPYDHIMNQLSPESLAPRLKSILASLK